MQGNTKQTEKELPYAVESHIGRSQVTCLLSSYDQAIASREIKPVNDRKIYGHFDHAGLITSDEIISLLAEEFFEKYSTNQHQERLAYFFSEIREKKKKLQMFQNKSIKLSIVMQKIVTQFFRYKNLIR